MYRFLRFQHIVYRCSIVCFKLTAQVTVCTCLLNYNATHLLEYLLKQGCSWQQQVVMSLHDVDCIFLANLVL